MSYAQFCHINDSISGLWQFAILTRASHINFNSIFDSIQRIAHIHYPLSRTERRVQSREQAALGLGSAGDIAVAALISKMQPMPLHFIGCQMCQQLEMLSLVAATAMETAPIPQSK